MGVYKNNKNGTLDPIATNLQVVNTPMEQFVSRAEFSAVTPNDISTNNKLVAENEVTKAVDTMPTASAGLVGTIVQYVGETTANYTNGYFYKCVSDGEATPTYSWVNVRVEDSGYTTYEIPPALIHSVGNVVNAFDVSKGTLSSVATQNVISNDTWFVKRGIQSLHLSTDNTQRIAQVGVALDSAIPVSDLSDYGVWIYIPYDTHKNLNYIEFYGGTNNNGTITNSEVVLHLSQTSANIGWNFVRFKDNVSILSFDCVRIRAVDISANGDATHYAKDIYLDSIVKGYTLVPSVLLTFDECRDDSIYDYCYKEAISRGLVGTFAYQNGLLPNGSLDPNYQPTTAVSREHLQEMYEHGWDATQYDCVGLTQDTDAIKAYNKALRDDGLDMYCYFPRYNQVTEGIWNNLDDMGFKMSRFSNSNKYIDAVGLNTYNCTPLSFSDDADVVKGHINTIIESNKMLCILIHKPVDSPDGTTGNCLKADYEEVLDYLAEKQNAGELQVITFKQMYKALSANERSSLSSLSDTSISSPQSGDVLVYDGEKWENRKDNPYYGKNVVHMGDSWVHIYGIAEDAAEKVGYNVTVCGFQGTAISDYNTIFSDALEFSLIRLAKAIQSGDWSAQDAAIAGSDSRGYTQPLTRLKAVDWANTDVLVLSYGVNDYGAQNPLGDVFARDEESVSGALISTINLLQSLNSNMEIIVTTPCFRYVSPDNSDVQNYTSYLINLDKYRKAIALSAKACAVKLIDMFAISGINGGNHSLTLLSDGLHPTTLGIDKWGTAFTYYIVSGYVGAIDTNNTFAFEADNLCFDSEKLDVHEKWNGSYTSEGVKYLCTSGSMQYRNCVLGMKHFDSLPIGTVIKLEGYGKKIGDTNHRLSFLILDSTKTNTLLDKYTAAINSTSDSAISYTFTTTEAYTDCWVIFITKNMSVWNDGKALVRDMKCTVTLPS